MEVTRRIPIIPSYDNPAYLIVEIIDLKNKDAQQRAIYLDRVYGRR